MHSVEDLCSKHMLINVPLTMDSHYCDHEATTAQTIINRRELPRRSVIVVGGWISVWVRACLLAIEARGTF